MKKLIGITCLLSLVFILMVSGALFPLSASSESGEQPIAPSCHALDVVFLVDQSDSMSGYAGSTPTDPTKQRQYAVEAVIDLLTDIALDLCPDVIHRVAVISYGSEAEIDLPLSEINPSTSTDAQQIRAALKQNVSAREMGQTHPKQAFELAAQILNDAAPIGDGIRKRAIVFITDGIPCVGPECMDHTFDFNSYAREMVEQVATDFPFDETLLQREACLNALRERLGPDETLSPEQVNTCLEDHQVGSNAYEESTYIWTILLSFGGDYTERLRDKYVEMSESHAGEVIYLSQSRQDIPTTFREILEQLTGVRAARLNCGNFAVNPYLDKARLVFYKFDESVVVSLSYTDVDGAVHTISNGQGDDGFVIEEYYQQGANERYVLSRPYPGIWTLASEDCDGLDAFYDPIAINPGGYHPNLPSEVAQRDRSPFYDEDMSFYLEYPMKDLAGQVILQAEHARFAVDIEVIVIDPEGNDKEYPMEWDGDDELFRAVEPLQVPIAGTYQISITGAAFRHEGEPTSVGNVYSEVFDTQYELFSQNAEFQVFPVTPFVIEILSPADGEELEPIHGELTPDARPPIQPISIRARVVDRQGQPSLDTGEIFLDQERALKAVVTAGTDSKLVFLTPDPAAPAEFIGQITDLDATGEHQLVVNLVGDFGEEYYPDNRSDEVNFSRVDEVWNFEIMTPAAGADLIPIHGTIADGWPLIVHPIPLRARIVDQEGERYDNIDEIMAYAPTVLTATVSAGEDSVSLPLLPDPDAPGEYTGEIVGLDASGGHTFVVDLGLDYPGYYTPESRPDTITFTRSDELLTTPATYYALLLFIILLIILRIIRYFAVRTNPVTGTLSFEDAGEIVAEFGLHSGKNWTVITSRMLKPYPQLDLKRLKVENIGKRKRGGKKGGEDDLLIQDSFTDVSAGDSGVRVQVTTLGKQRFSVPLTPGLPTIYGDSIFQMVYKTLE